MTMLWTPEMIAVSFDGTAKLIMNFTQSSPWDTLKNNFPILENSYNPWTGSASNAPFDQYFYLILNVAVGCGISTGCYFTDPPWFDQTICPKGTPAQNCFQTYLDKNPNLYDNTTPFVVETIEVWPRESYGGTPATVKCTAEEFSGCVTECAEDVRGRC